MANTGLSVNLNTSALDAKVSAYVRTIDPAGPKARKLLLRIGKLIEFRHKQHWIPKELDINGNKFKRLSDAYANEVRNGSSGPTTRGYDHILIDEGNMLGSVGPEIVGSAVFVGPRSAAEERIGAGHQHGIGRRRERAWLGIRDADRPLISLEADDWFEQEAQT